MVMLFGQMYSVTCMGIVGGKVSGERVDFPRRGEGKGDRRWLEGDVAMSVIIVVYPEFSFLLNLDLSSALLIVYSVTLLHIHLGKVSQQTN